jgi:hypothetical protein
MLVVMYVAHCVSDLGKQDTTLPATAAAWPPHAYPAGYHTKCNMRWQTLAGCVKYSATCWFLGTLRGGNRGGEQQQGQLDNLATVADCAANTWLPRTAGSMAPT